MARAAIGSALGLTPEQVTQGAHERQQNMRALRTDLIAALVTAEDALYRREAPIDVVLALHNRLEGMLTRWRS